MSFDNDKIEHLNNQETLFYTLNQRIDKWQFVIFTDRKMYSDKKDRWVIRLEGSKGKLLNIYSVINLFQGRDPP